MLAKNIYHGTERVRGELMLSNKGMIETIGDNHWLGNGSYFYEDDFYAYKWIKNMFNRDNKTFDVNELFNKFIIIIGKHNIDDERIFNLDNPRHKMIYDKVYLECKKRLSNSNKFSHKVMAEGVVLNIMFNEMKFIDRFDVVIATFSMRRDKYSNEYMRLNSMPEKQICFKNLEKRKPDTIYNCLDKIDEFEECIRRLDFNSKNTTDINEYRVRRKKVKYR